MDELQTIREALEYADSFGEEQTDIYTKALAALSRLEARAAEMPEARRLISKIRKGNEVDGVYQFSTLDREAAAMIGQYAYRYSEAVREDRDYWKSLVNRAASILALGNKKLGACPNCGASPLTMEAYSRNGVAGPLGDSIAVCQSCKKPMPEGWSSK